MTAPGYDGQRGFGVRVRDLCEASALDSGDSYVDLQLLLVDKAWEIAGLWDVARDHRCADWLNQHGTTLHCRLCAALARLEDWA